MSARSMNETAAEEQKKGPDLDQRDVPVQQ
jgi:hypothetical protein